MPKKKPTQGTQGDLFESPDAEPQPPQVLAGPSGFATGETFSFDVRWEKWIPVVDAHGKNEELSLRDALCRAHEWAEVRDSLLTVEFGIYRLLIAFVLDIWQPKNLSQLSALLRAGRFDAAQVDEYFERPDVRDRCDLFHAQTPFLQSGGMDDEKPKPLAGMVHPLPSGTNALHFHHESEDNFAVCPSTAARLLTTIAPFMTAGGAGLSPSINGSPPWYVLLRGRSGFETLCLNSLALADRLRPTRGNREEVPAWRDAPRISNERRTEATLLESLTWRPRRVQLVPQAAPESWKCCLSGQESRVQVGSMKFTAGWGGGFSWRDPAVPYRINDEGASVLRPRENRESWRDTGPIALLREGEYQTSDDRKLRFERPSIITQLAEMHSIDPDTLPPLDLMLYGMRTDLKMKIFEWHRESLSLPDTLLWQSSLHGHAQGEMEKAESIGAALRRAIKLSYPRGGAGNDAARERLVARTQAAYWADLRTHYDAFLHAIAPLDEQPQELKDAITLWRGAIKRVGWEALREAIDDLDTQADALQRQTEAYRAFSGALFVVLDPTARDKKDKKKEKTT